MASVNLSWKFILQLETLLVILLDLNKKKGLHDSMTCKPTSTSLTERVTAELPLGTRTGSVLALSRCLGTRRALPRVTLLCFPPRSTGSACASTTRRGRTASSVPRSTTTALGRLPTAKPEPPGSASVSARPGPVSLSFCGSQMLPPVLPYFFPREQMRRGRGRAHATMHLWGGCPQGASVVSGTFWGGTASWCWAAVPPRCGSPGQWQHSPYFHQQRLVPGGAICPTRTPTGS